MLALLKLCSAELFIFQSFFKRISCSALVSALLASCANEPLDSAHTLNKSLKTSISGGYLAGRYARRDNDTKMASINFQLARSKEPNNITLIREAFLSELRLGNVEEAVKLAEHSILSLIHI